MKKIDEEIYFLLYIIKDFVFVFEIIYIIIIDFKYIYIKFGVH